MLVAARASISTKSVWAGRLFTMLTAFFILFDAVIHLLKPAPVVQAFAELGYPIGLSVTLGIIELLCLVVYLVPRTTIFGAILLTGYLGGAVATQLRVGNPLFAQALFPVYIGMLLWAGILLRDERLRALIPLRH